MKWNEWNKVINNSRLIYCKIQDFNNWTGMAGALIYCKDWVDGGLVECPNDSSVNYKFIEIFIMTVLL